MELEVEAKEPAEENVPSHNSEPMTQTLESVHLHSQPNDRDQGQMAATPGPGPAPAHNMQEDGENPRSGAENLMPHDASGGQGQGMYTTPTEPQFQLQSLSAFPADESQVRPAELHLIAQIRTSSWTS